MKLRNRWIVAVLALGPLLPAGLPVYPGIFVLAVGPPQVTNSIIE